MSKLFGTMVGTAIAALLLILHVWLTIGRQRKDSGFVPWWLRALPCVFLFLAMATYIVGTAEIGIIDRSHDLRPLPNLLEKHHRQLSIIRDYLRKYHDKTGRYPTNDQGLYVVSDLVKEYRNHPVEWNSQDDAFEPYKAPVIYTVFGEPFVYENRNGTDPKNFADSPAANDKADDFSIRVDKDIYVWSIGALQASQKLHFWQSKLDHYQRRVDLASILILALCLLSTIWLLKIGHKTGRNLGLSPGMILTEFVIFWLAASFIFPMYAVSCYEGSLFAMRTPELTKDYLQLVEKYHSRGVIGDDAYKKLIKAVED